MQWDDTAQGEAREGVPEAKFKHASSCPYTRQSPGGKLEGSVNSNNHTCMYEKVYPGDSGGVIGTPSKDVFEWDM